MRDSAGSRLFPRRGFPLSLERQIDDAFHQMMIADEEGDRLLACLKLKRLCREARPLPPDRTPSPSPGSPTTGVPARGGRIS
jgi:hypothetical protein